MNKPLFCMCGAQIGYPHEDFCPFPYYGNEKWRMDSWIDASRELEARRAEKQEQEQEQDQSAA